MDSVIKQEGNLDSGCLLTIVICIVIILTVFITDACHRKKPQAMDVYQGKTTLNMR